MGSEAGRGRSTLATSTRRPLRAAMDELCALSGPLKGDSDQKSFPAPISGLRRWQRAQRDPAAPRHETHQSEVPLFAFRIPPKPHVAAATQALTGGASPIAVVGPWRQAQRLARLSKTNVSHWRQYQIFCTSVSVPVTPILVDHLEAFMLDYSVTRGNSSASLNSVMSSLKRAAVTLGHQWPNFSTEGMGESMTSRIEAVQRDWPALVQGTPPLTFEMGLLKVFSYLRSLPQNLWVLQWKALASLMHATFLRPGDIIPSDVFPATPGVPLGFAYPRRGDIVFVEPTYAGVGGGMEYTAWLFKQEKLVADRRTCTVAAVSLDGDEAIDAPRAMREYLVAANLMRAPATTPVLFYRRRDGSPRHHRQSSSSLLHEFRAEIMRPAGVDGWNVFTLRSFRPGGLSDMRAAHVPAEITGKVGRWKSKKAQDKYDRSEHYLLHDLSTHRSSLRYRQQ